MPSPHHSTLTQERPRNEGVPGSSPGVGFTELPAQTRQCDRRRTAAYSRSPTASRASSRSRKIVMRLILPAAKS
jgi:hypothetical protein